MSGLTRSADDMVRVWQSLRATWESAQSSWKDRDRDRFEQEHVQEIAQVTNSYIGSLRNLAESVQRILNAAP